MNTSHSFKQFFWILISLVLISFISPSVAGAQSNSSGEIMTTWTLSQLYNEPSIRLEGYRPVAALNLTIPHGWQPSSDGTLTLDYRISNLVIEGATLTVRLNDQPIASSNFELEAGLLTIVIPGDYFIPGENILEFVAFLPLGEDITCIVPNHPGRWLEFGPGSYLGMALEPTDVPFMLADFPAQFYALGNDNDAQITFVIPESPTNDELNALSAVGFALGRDRKIFSQWQTVSADEFYTEGVLGPIIMIGENDNITQLISLMPPNGEEAGWLSLTRPDWSGGYPVLAIGGPNGEGVLQAAKSLLDPLALAQMGTNVSIVDTLAVEEPYSLEEQFTLADLGYGERVLRGTGELSLIYYFDIPFAWSPENGQIALNFAHSANLNPEVASLTVLLNGHTSVGLRLDAPETASNEVEVSIPKEFFRPGRNFLRLTFDFGPPIEYCLTSASQQAWASVRPETTLKLLHGNLGGRLNLKDFPFSFSSETDTAALSIILPETITHGDLTQALGLVRSLSTEENRFPPRFVLANDISAEVKSGHLIVIGPYEQQSFLSDLESYLPFSFKNNRLSAYGIRLPHAAPDPGVIQVIRSPWADNRAILVVSGKNKASYDLAIQLTTDPLLQTELDDQLVIVWPSNDADFPQVYNQPIPDISALPGVGFIDKLFGGSFEPGSPWPTIILVSVGLIVLALGGVFVLKWISRGQSTSSDDH